jgi:hypothetical protein
MGSYKNRNIITCLKTLSLKYNHSVQGMITFLVTLLKSLGVTHVIPSDFNKNISI